MGSAFFFAVPMIQWDSNPVALRLLGYGKPLQLPLGGGCLDFFAFAYGISGSFFLSLGGGSM